MKRLIQAFLTGLQEGCRPLLVVMLRLLRALGNSGLLLLAGFGAITLSTRMGEGASGMSLLGQGLMIGAALYGGVAMLQAWLGLFRAARCPEKRS
ncbi:MAG: hypothetical protein HY847_02380 [Betaproteobacteria bacterium]|nr:hypothetical protein [Betaproteobacteria bacterium]